MAKQVKETSSKASVTATVTRQYFEGKNPSTPESVTNETIGVHTFVSTPATVGIEKGLTINLGNYESARVAVTFSVPCYVEEADAAFTFADKWVEDRLQVEVQSLRANKPSVF